MDLYQLESEVMETINSAPRLESVLVSQFWKKVRATRSAGIDVSSSRLPPVTIRMIPGTIDNGDFVGAMPVRSFVSLAKYGYISRMKNYLESGKPAKHSYDSTVPPDVVVAYAVPQREEPYVTIAGTPQRIIRLLKDRDAEFYELLVSDDNNPPWIQRKSRRDQDE